MLTGVVGGRLIGVVATAIALVLVLPIPFANLLPAMFLAVLALGLVRRRGLLVAGGYVLFAFALAVTSVGAGGAVVRCHWIARHI